MKKPATQFQKEMTITEVGRLVIGLANKIDTIESSVDSLAVATHKGFEEVNNRIDRVERRMEEGFQDLRYCSFVPSAVSSTS